MLYMKFPLFAKKMNLKSESFETFIQRLDDAEEPGTPDKHLRGLKFDKNYNYSRRPSKLRKQRWNFLLCNFDVEDIDSGSEVDEDEKEEFSRRELLPSNSNTPAEVDLADFMRSRTVSDLSSRASPAGYPSHSPSTKANSNDSGGHGSSPRDSRQLESEIERRLRRVSRIVGGKSRPPGSARTKKAHSNRKSNRRDQRKGRDPGKQERRGGGRDRRNREENSVENGVQIRYAGEEREEKYGDDEKL